MNKKRIINMALLIVVVALVVIVISKSHLVKYEYTNVPVIAQSDMVISITNDELMEPVITEDFEKTNIIIKGICLDNFFGYDFFFGRLTDNGIRYKQFWGNRKASDTLGWAMHFKETVNNQTIYVTTHIKDDWSDALFIKYYNSSIPLTSLEETESTIVLDTVGEKEETEILNVLETEAPDKFNLKTVNFPIVEGKALGRIIGFVDKNTALCGMEDPDSDTLNDMTELGYWHLDTGTYSTMSTVQGGWWYLVAHNEDYMFFDVMYNLNGGLNNNKGQLMCYNRNDESWKVILEYSENEEGDVAYIEKHQRLIHEGYLYFEDNLFVPGGMNMSTAYRLNLSTMELENLGQNLKNPQLYEGDIWYIETTEQGQALKNVETGVSVELPSNVYQIAVIGDGVWVTYDTGVHSAQTTVSMKEGIDENIVGIPTASVFQSTDYIAWESSVIDVPELYSKKKQQVVSIDEISVGSHFYYLQDDYGLIESWIPRGNEPSEVIYTFFERVD